MLSILLIAIVVASMCQPNPHRCLVALSFSLPCAVLDFFNYGLIGTSYYLAAGLCCTLIILLTGMIRPITKLIIQLQLICLVALGVNAAGWLAYMAYASPVFYNYAMIGLYVWAIYALCDKDEVINGGHKLGISNKLVVVNRVVWWDNGIHWAVLPSGSDDKSNNG